MLENSSTGIPILSSVTNDMDIIKRRSRDNFDSVKQFRSTIVKCHPISVCEDLDTKHSGVCALELHASNSS